MLPRASRAVVTVLLVGTAIYFLYLFDLTAMGLVMRDEPRYASIGRAMAQSGDWITPRLWGEPWFEKPPLLYWMTGAAFRLRLSADLAPRLPVALLSVAFLLFYAWILRREFGMRAAVYAAVMLGTSAGWLAYSHVSVTDLPLAATFSAAMLLTLPWIRLRERRWLMPASAMLALAVLAKGLVPLVLALPLLWIGRKQWRDLLAPRPVLIFAAIALPWYSLCTIRNGTLFPRTFFWEHHFQRFTSNALQHGQPFWYYAPVFLLAFFPWTPMLLVLFRRDLYRDARMLFLLLWLAFGFLFFSAAANKLPGYLLPLLPAAAALGGIGAARARSAGGVLFACTILLSLTPLIAAILPPALAAGSFRFSFLAQSSWKQFWAISAGLILAGIILWFLDLHGRRNAAFASLAGLTILSVVYLETAAFPVIDQAASARPIWRELQGRDQRACIGNIDRSWRYGLNYYSVLPLPDCREFDAPLAVVPGQARPQLRGNQAGLPGRER
ncbi:MAG: glycosyltransferase family 39 protein [Acidobacteriota bacterium]|nr:glycosyltransferase family 39 protein [Acidobacteriota bacterium]